MKKLYEETDVQAIADEIRGKKNLQIDKVDKMKINAMASAINGIRLGCPINVSIHMRDGEWVRPDGWTDLDALPCGEDELYMTFDASDRISDSHCSFSISGASYTVEINGKTWTQDAGSTFSYAFETADGEYPLVHVKANGHITAFTFKSFIIDGKTYSERRNPLVERVGDVYDYGSATWGTYYLEREKVARHSSSDIGLYSTWNSCYSLQSLDLSGWDTTNWVVTTLYSTWSSCYSLQSLDLSGWDTSGWAVTTIDMVGTIARLFNCKKIDLRSIDMSKVTRIGQNDSWYRSFTGLLQDFTCGSNNYGKFNPTAYNYLYVECPCLTHDSIIEMGKMLATVTTPHYFKLSFDLATTLTEAERAEITAKGWTIA